jgi:multiple sugar transport system permease protein
MSAAAPRARSRTFTGYILLGFLCLYFLLPLWWLVVASTKDNAALFGGAGGTLWFDDSFSLVENIIGISTYENGIYWRWLANSFIYALLGGVGATIISVLAGYGFAKFNFRGKHIYLAAVLGAVMVPTTALTIPIFVIFSNAGLTNTVWGVILPSLLSPFGVYLMYVFAQDALPDELLDAARIDGAGEIRVIWSIVLPLLKPAIVTVLLLSIVHTWNNFFLPFIMLSDSRLLPVTVGLNQWQAQATTASGVLQPWSYIVTGALISIVPLVIAFLSLQRYWKGGISLGSLK